MLTNQSNPNKILGKQTPTCWSWKTDTKICSLEGANQCLPRVSNKKLVNVAAKETLLRREAAKKREDNDSGEWVTENTSINRGGDGECP